jgi:hypothetical protein
LNNTAETRGTPAPGAAAHTTLDADAAQLQALGYTSKFDRTMTELENFSLGFTYLSPVVGVYSLFGFALAAGGPPMFWWYLLVGIGQMFVCLVFGEVVSQFPISRRTRRRPGVLRLVRAEPAGRRKSPAVRFRAR